MKTLSTMYDNAELCGYIHMDNMSGIGFIPLSPEDDFYYRADDYYVVCSVGRQKPSYRHCKVHYSADRKYVLYRGMKIYLDDVMMM